MKRNNIYTALLSLSLLGLGACSLDLEPLTSPSSASYPSSMEEANFGLNAVYSSLTAYSASTTTWWKVTDNITDIWCYTCQHGYVYGINHLRSFC